MKLNEGRISPVLRKIHNNVKPEDTGIDVKSIWHTCSDSVLVKLGLETDKKKTFCETVHSIQGTKAAVSSVEPICNLKIRDLDCCVNKEKMEETIKTDYTDVRNFKVGFTSTSQRINISRCHLWVPWATSPLRKNKDRVDHLQDKPKGSSNPLP